MKVADTYFVSLIIVTMTSKEYWPLDPNFITTFGHKCHITHLEIPLSQFFNRCGLTVRVQAIVHHSEGTNEELHSVVWSEFCCKVEQG